MDRSEAIYRRIDAASRRATPAGQHADPGRITPGKVSAALTILGSATLAALVLASITATSASSPGWGAFALTGLLSLPGLFMLPSLTTRHDVTWDAHGVSGARRMFGPTLGWARTTLAWREIAGTGKTVTGYWYAQAEDGRRVYWSYLYPGYPALVAQLAHHRPDVDLAPVLDMPW